MKIITTLIIIAVVWALRFGLAFATEALNERTHKTGRATPAVFACLVGFLSVFINVLCYSIYIALIPYAFGWDKLLAWLFSLVLLASAVIATVMTAMQIKEYRTDYNFNAGFPLIVFFILNWFNYLFIGKYAIPAAFTVSYGHNIAELPFSILRICIFIFEIVLLIYSLRKER